MQKDSNLSGKVVLITGGARRVGAVTARTLHAAGMNVVLHYRTSEGEAARLQSELHAVRPASVALVRGDLLQTAGASAIVQEAAAAWGRLDVLVNNASSFYPTPLASATEAQWDELLGSNLKAPFFLAQAAAPHLERSSGCIVNMADIYAERPLKAYPVYSIAKAGVVMLTKALARELAPAVRVNAVAPGAILWPEDMEEAMRKRILSRTALQREGAPEDVARAVLFLVRDADYVTGQVIAVDGGRSIYA
jgi:pteridine reductase